VTQKIPGRGNTICGPSLTREHYKKQEKKEAKIKSGHGKKHESSKNHYDKRLKEKLQSPGRSENGEEKEKKKGKTIKHDITSREKSLM